MVGGPYLAQALLLDLCDVNFLLSHVFLKASLVSDP
jgi:hypothetical protein